MRPRWIAVAVPVTVPDVAARWWVALMSTPTEPYGAGCPVAAGLTVFQEVGAPDVDLAGDQQLFGREARDHLAAGCGDDDLFFASGSGAVVSRGAIGLEREHHSFLDFDGMVK